MSEESKEIKISTDASSAFKTTLAVIAAKWLMVILAVFATCVIIFFCAVFSS